MTNKQIAIKYANDVICGIKPNCQHIINACKRFMQDLESELYYYDDDKVDDVIDFLNALPLSDEFDTQKFLLADWQTFFVCNMYGFIVKATGKRKYRKVLLQIPRKNGKSEIITNLALYHLLKDSNAEIVCAANTRSQVKDIIFKKLGEKAKWLDPKQRQLKKYYSTLKYKKSWLYAISSDASKQDGYNISVGIIDECEEAKDNQMYNVIKSSQGSRSEPLIILIMTAGFNQQNFAYEIRQHCINVLNGTVEDPAQLALLYGLDENDDYTQPECIAKANPNLGISVSREYIEDEVRTSINNPIDANSVKVKHFNIWQSSSTPELAYIPDEAIVKVMQPLSMPEGQNVWIGIDLASTMDIAAVTYQWLGENGRLCFKNAYYLPADNMSSTSNKIKYNQWSDEGYLFLSQGNVTDYDRIKADILEVGKHNNICVLSYDKWNSSQMIIDLTNSYINCIPASQSTNAINAPAKQLIRLVLSERVTIDSNPVTRWMFNNVVIKVNAADNIKPEKTKAQNKIDGVYSILTSLIGFIENPMSDFKVY